MGSSERVLGLIKIKSAEIYPNLEVVTSSFHLINQSFLKRIMLQL